MTKLIITIDMDNAAFFDPRTKAHFWLSEASLILRNLADRVYNHGEPAEYPLLLRDRNGNKVGEAVLDTDL